VEHCPDAWAVGLQHTEGWSLVYSGDTRPCEAVARLGRAMRPAARILLHEATFDDSEPMQREAVAKRHSTLSEALGIGAQMGAWRVLLTHFSQRYPKLGEAGEARINHATLALDMMTVPFPLLPALPALTPALQCCLLDVEPDGAADADGAAAEASTAAPDQII